MRILIADDQVTNLKLLRAQLEGEGQDVVEAADGFAALEVLKHAAVDAIITDILMPRMDGYRLCYEVRKNPVTQEIPIIVYTATYTSPSDEKLAHDVGADAYLRKPAAVSEIVGALRKATRGDRARSPMRLADEVVVMREYNERLVAKLEQKNAELMLRGTAVDTAANAIIITDAQGVILWTNPAFTVQTGYTAAEVLGRTPRVLKSGRHDEAFHRDFWATILSGKTWRGEFTNRRKDGTFYYDEHTVTPVRTTGGAITHFIGVTHDVTARKQGEEELRRTKDEYQSIFQNAIEGIYRSTPDGTFQAVNPAMARILGYASPQEMMRECRAIARQFFADPGVRDEFKHRTETDGVVVGFEYEAVRKDGSRIWVSVNARAIRDAHGRVVSYEGSLVDITERRVAEERLKLQHDVTAALAEAGSFAQTNQKVLATVGRAMNWDLGEVWTVDRPATVLRYAESWHPNSTGFREFAAASREMTFARGHGLPGRVWASGRPEWIPEIAQEPGCVRRTLAGRLGLHSWIGFPITLRGESLGVVGFFSAQVRPPDEQKLAMFGGFGTQIGQFIERQQLAEQFRQTQKMEAIGTLAGGIAHDFNNILAAITGYADLAKMELGNDAAVREYLDGVSTGANRATSLVRQITTFSRQHEQERRPLQPRHIVAEAVKLLRATIPATVEFELTFSHETPVVLADPTQIHQIVMNLGTNAAHAMRDRQGRLRIALEPVAVDAGLVAAHPALCVGAYARLTVSDNGCGMDAATREQIFEPFFTTKAPGEGTGLGLSVVHGIVRAHEGAITVSSHPGAGTTFQVYFPAHVSEMAEEVKVTADQPRGGGQRILVVDDEAPIATVSQKIVGRLGYSAEMFTNPTRALETLVADPAAFDLVLTDQTMPGMTGIELAEKIAELRPDLPVVLATGYTAALRAERLKSAGIRLVLQKPVSVEALAFALHQVLSAKTTPPAGPDRGEGQAGPAERP